ncbi:tyrosine phosphatase family-domain-containing protein [Radiomyces spectabilis]|uniref:tyrosine phosphatase family-domain-containing protein n=1 Tax=Radiomyces spectabilis TaxID=64574 RepID=UPI00221EEB42|nr:tyrosine phosphatase family-domain-containing protein [Radiomyces spectabilis]KAI8394159.1 tyrosine phosphatase family-domain-containing protein [Radiomyces spectabilis]
MPLTASDTSLTTTDDKLRSRRNVHHSNNHYDTCSICYERPGFPLVPPLNFAMIAPGVYRSGHPNKQNFSFLRKLGLKTIMYFATEDYPPEMVHFIEREGIEVFHYRMEGNKEPFIEMNPDDISHALVKLLDERSHPVLIHCLKGKHRIGCLVGCLRKIQRWSMTSIFDEYRKFAGTKVLADQEFIEIFDHQKVPYDPKYQPAWL